MNPPPVHAGMRVDLPPYVWGKKEGSAPTPTFRRWPLLDWSKIREEWSSQQNIK